MLNYNLYEFFATCSYSGENIINESYRIKAINYQDAKDIVRIKAIDIIDDPKFIEKDFKIYFKGAYQK